jgi:hypothetical protein
MKKLVMILIAGALVSPVFAEPRPASSNEYGANAQAVAKAPAMFAAANSTTRPAQKANKAKPNREIAWPTPSDPGVNASGG